MAGDAPGEGGPLEDVDAPRVTGRGEHCGDAAPKGSSPKKISSAGSGLLLGKTPWLASVLRSLELDASEMIESLSSPSQRGHRRELLLP